MSYIKFTTNTPIILGCITVFYLNLICDTEYDHEIDEHCSESVTLKYHVNVRCRQRSEMLCNL